MRRPFRTTLSATPVTSVFVSSAAPVRFLSELPQPRTVATLLGGGRIALGGVFLAAPEFAVRAVGLDAASARRIVWLSRMTAGRDIAIGVGTLVSALHAHRGGTSTGAAGWVAAGAAADAVDSLALAAAVRSGRLGGVGAVGMVGGAALAAAVGFWAAVGLRGRG